MSGNRTLVRRQLFVFAAVAAVAVLIVSLSYLQVPRLLGWDRMTATAQLPAAGGLAANARVTYRGVEVGKVVEVSLAPAGVVARLSLDRGAQLPAQVRGQVHSSSVIGEQYLELLPTDGSLDGQDGTERAGLLAQGAVIPAARTRPVPVDAGTLLSTLDALIRSVDGDSLRTTVDELDTAFSGSGESLSRLLDGGSALVGDARANLGPTKELLANLEPVLATQEALGPDIEALAENLDTVTGTLRVSDAQLRGLIASTPAAADQIVATVTDLHPMLPQVLADLAGTGQVLRIYLPGIKQILVIYPAVVGTLQMIPLSAEVPGRSNMYFHVNINDPGSCTQGFTGKRRSPNVVTSAGTIDNGWCKAPTDAKVSVRGSHNAPCPTNGLRSATAAGCGYDFTKPLTTTLTSYDPRTGEFRGPDGRLYTIDLGVTGRAGVSAYSSGLLKALSDN